MTEHTFDLRIRTADGRTRTVQWSGTDGLNACHRYAATFPGVEVLAWRTPRESVDILGDASRIIG